MTGKIEVGLLQLAMASKEPPHKKLKAEKLDSTTASKSEFSKQIKEDRSKSFFKKIGRLEGRQLLRGYFEVLYILGYRLTPSGESILQIESLFSTEAEATNHNTEDRSGRRTAE
uniref:Uncharacterized protein n=1 Tax=Timema genevievae TaxID=629358 RepID=A0A7R9PPB9_TIMGE|nr:unnamed protein product [Timema genevievae]